jgi:transposase
MKGDRLVIKEPSDLQVHLGQETDVKIRLKLAFLQCFAQLKADLEPLCQAFGIATSTGYWWIRNWNKSGYEGLQESMGGNAGRPSQLDDVDLDYLSLLLKKKTCWTTQEARELVKASFGVEYSPGQVVRILRKRLKMHFCKPFPHDYRRPANAEDISKERLEKHDIALGFMDGSSPQNRANTVRVWSFERNPVMIKNTDHFKSNTIGFYAIEGHSHPAFLANSQASIQAFLEQIKAAEARLGIYRVYLPAYSPDLNPEEYLWKSMKRELSKDFIKTIDQMKATIKKVWNELSVGLGFAKHWIEEFLPEGCFYSGLAVNYNDPNSV